LAISRADLNHSPFYLSAQILYCLNAAQGALIPSTKSSRVVWLPSNLSMKHLY